jgi:hypothetical protein
MQQGSVGSGKFLERILCFSEGGCADATVLGVIRQLLSVWCGPDGCSIASNLINGHSGIAATGVVLADLPIERQECRSFEGEAQITPAANAVGGVGRWWGLGEPVGRLRTGWPGAADRLPDKEFGADAQSVHPVSDPAAGGEQKLARG